MFLLLLKFCAVGSAGLVVDFSVTYQLKEKWLWNKFISNSTGFLMASSSNYVFNRLWTFKSDNPEIWAEYLGFISISVIGLLINNLTIWLSHQKLGLNFYLAKGIAVVFTTLWCFIANCSFNFN